MKIDAVKGSKEDTAMQERKLQMQEFMKNFEGMPDRLLKYCEILLEGEDASPYCYQDTMSLRGIAIALTAKCNMHCAWCYRFDEAYKNVLDIELPFEKLESIVKNTKGRFRRVHLAGLGETTLYPRLLDAIKLVKKLSDRVKFTTNATRLTEEYIDSLAKSGLTDIEISICVFDEKKEKELRGVDLRRSLKSAVYISNETDIDLQVNTLVSSMNYKFLFNLVDQLKEAKKLTIHTIPLFETHQCREAGIRRVSAQDYRALLNKIKADIDKYDLDWDMSPTPEGSVLDPIIEMKVKKNICFTCFEDPYISEKGELLPCVRQKPHGGVDATGGFEKAWNHPRLLEYRRNMLKGCYPPLCGQICYLKER